MCVGPMSVLYVNVCMSVLYVNVCMSVLYVNVCMSVLYVNVCMSVLYVNVCMSVLYVNVCMSVLYVNVCMSVLYVNVCMFVSICIFVSVYMYICVYLSVRPLYIYIHIYTYIYIYIHIYTRVHIYIYIYIYIYMVVWCYQRLLRVSWVERKTNKWVLEKIGSVLMLRKSMAERKMRFFGHIVRKNGMEKRLMQGKVEGKRRRGRPTTAWFQDLKEWTKLNIAAASQLATDRERWREIIKVTAAQIVPPD